MQIITPGDFNKQPYYYLTTDHVVKVSRNAGRYYKSDIKLFQCKILGDNNNITSKDKCDSCKNRPMNHICKKCYGMANDKIFLNEHNIYQRYVSDAYHAIIAVWREKAGLKYIYHEKYQKQNFYYPRIIRSIIEYETYGTKPNCCCLCDSYSNYQYVCKYCLDFSKKIYVDDYLYKCFLIQQMTFLVADVHLIIIELLIINKKN